MIAHLKLCPNSSNPCLVCLDDCKPSSDQVSSATAGHMPGEFIHAKTQYTNPQSRCAVVQDLLNSSSILHSLAMHILYCKQLHCDSNIGLSSFLCFFSSYQFSTITHNLSRTRFILFGKCVSFFISDVSGACVERPVTDNRISNEDCEIHSIYKHHGSKYG